MKKYYVLFFVFLISGCVTASPQYTNAPPSVSQVQGGCFASREKFLDQASCIRTAFTHSDLNPYAQEYMALLQSLTSKVKSSKLSDDDARLQLTQRLNDLRQKQNTEFAQQQAIANQQAAQTQRILQQNKPVLLEPYQMPGLPNPVNTNCQTYGNQVSCTSY